MQVTVNAIHCVYPQSIVIVHEMKWEHQFCQAKTLASIGLVLFSKHRLAQVLIVKQTVASSLMRT